MDETEYTPEPTTYDDGAVVEVDETQNPFVIRLDVIDGEPTRVHILAEFDEELRKYIAGLGFTEASVLIMRGVELYIGELVKE